MDSLFYRDLVQVRLKAYRNGNWRKLSAVEKALLNASIMLAKLRGRVVNPSLVERIRSIVSRLLETAATRILQLGRDQAKSLLKLYSRNGVLKYLPEIKNWLEDPRFLIWLGVNQLAIRSVGMGID